MEVIVVVLPIILEDTVLEGHVIIQQAYLPEPVEPFAPQEQRVLCTRARRLVVEPHAQAKHKPVMQAVLGGREVIQVLHAPPQHAPRMQQTLLHVVRMDIPAKDKLAKLMECGAEVIHSPLPLQIPPVLCMPRLLRDAEHMELEVKRRHVNLVDYLTEPILCHRHLQQVLEPCTLQQPAPVERMDQIVNRNLVSLVGHGVAPILLLLHLRQVPELCMPQQPAPVERMDQITKLKRVNQAAHGMEAIVSPLPHRQQLAQCMPPR